MTELTARGTERKNRLTGHEMTDEARLVALKDIAKENKLLIEYYSDNSGHVKVDVFTPTSKHLMMSPAKFKRILIKPEVLRF